MEIESTRSLKISKQIQKDISEIFQKECSFLVIGAMVSVTVVRMSPDFALAKVYLSIFPFDKSEAIMLKMREHAWQVRMALGKRMKNQIKSIPEVAFFLDDSMEYAENIDQIFKTSINK